MRATSRREFLAVGGMSTAALLLGTGERTSGRALRLRSFAAEPFSLGVASGDPASDGFVLWTRLAPDPLAGGGMPEQPVLVRYEVARDEGFHRIVRRGEAEATPALGHSVHPEISGLEPDNEYFYRFAAGDSVSPVGRARTAPRAAAWKGRLRFAFASCQNFEQGYYTSHAHLAQEDLAFVAFLGDYIYEGTPNPAALRRHEGTSEPLTLVGYRNRHAQYRSDPNLQAAHAACPWIVTLDDHEIDNNWADDIPQDPQNQSPEAFRARRIAALQAYYEHMPLRREALPAGPDLKLYRRLSFGDLISVHVLDTRQYRTDQPTTLAGAEDPAATMTGAEQEAWLVDGLTRSRTRWNLIAQQTMIAQNDRRAGPTESYDFDNWDGYRVQRRRLLDLFGSGRVTNPVVLTGDRHATWVSDLKEDFYDGASRTVGAELTGTSLSSGGDSDPVTFHATYDPIKAESLHWKYIDNRRGYFVCDCTPRRIQADLRTVSTVRAQSASIATGASFELRDGQPGVRQVA